MTTSTLRKTLPALPGPAYALAITSDGAILVAGSNAELYRIVPDN